MLSTIKPLLKEGKMSDEIIAKLSSGMRLKKGMVRPGDEPFGEF